MTKSQSIAQRFVKAAQNYIKYGTSYPERLEVAKLPETPDIKASKPTKRRKKQPSS